MKAILKAILYRPLYNALIFLVWFIPGHNVAWAIIILTVVVRLALLPPSLKANRSQIRMHHLQPEMRKLQEKYKDDKQAQSKALMEFYKKHKVSPWGSCLPLLIQLPILIVLYYVFINGLSMERFDLLYAFTPRPEVINTIWLGIDLAKPDKFIFPIIAGAMQFIQGWQMQSQFKPSPTSQGKGADMQGMLSKQMLYIMPVFTVIISMSLPAALPLYWILTTIFGIFVWWWAEKTTPKIEISDEKLEISDKQGAWTKEKKEEIHKSTKHGVEVTVRRKK
ncbi:MAG: rane protein insertase, YidC/Oxa1 family, preprotein translocase subunit YidC [Candidatus Berkelbacteria bacterium]|nr:rane protein insertase, YidC/Oxa1 family, preprotein translocase subunit YidC [Candidatus Berkelbacteria bacterium]